MRQIWRGIAPVALLIAFAGGSNYARGDEPPTSAPGPSPGVATPTPALMPVSGPVPEPGARYCSGEYADEIAALSAKAREFEQQQPAYTFCIRTAATYECPSYAQDGTLRRTLRKVLAHGTGFAYRQQGGETYLVTNDHVAEWPAVTDGDHPVDEVPPGCKRVSDSLKIVESESDAYERDDVPLTRVVVDPQLDIAVLKAKVPLPVLPWRIGRSAALRERNAVDVRGFPLGVLRANNVGKVISAYTHDDDAEWDHDDFVVDALLSPGNSGSPVFAISCKTGEFELVGVYHAGYTRGSALNVVIGVDQLRDLFTTLKRSVHSKSDGAFAPAADDRARVLDGAERTDELFFPFGSLAAAVRPRPDGALVFEVMGKEFPVRPTPSLVIEDLPASDGFGTIGRVWAGNGQGLVAIDRSALDADAQSQLSKLLDALRHDALLAATLHQAARQGTGTRERFTAVARLERSLRRTSMTRQDLDQLAADLSEHLCPASAEATITLADALMTPALPERPPVAPEESATNIPLMSATTSPPATAAQ